MRLLRFGVWARFALGGRLLLLLLLFVGQAFPAEDYFFKANELYDQGKYKEAVPLYRAAIDEGRYEPFAWFNLGNSLVQLDRKQVAMYRGTFAEL